MKTNRDYQQEYRARMAKEFERFILYIPKEDYARVLEVAVRQGWISSTGRAAGQPNVQEALVSIVRAGLESFEG